jgi:hypothetical protein
MPERGKSRLEVLLIHDGAKRAQGDVAGAALVAKDVAASADLHDGARGGAAVGA